MVRAPGGRKRGDHGDHGLIPPLAVVAPHPRDGGSAVTSIQAQPRPQALFDHLASDNARVSAARSDHSGSRCGKSAHAACPEGGFAETDDLFMLGGEPDAVLVLGPLSRRHAVTPEQPTSRQERLATRYRSAVRRRCPRARSGPERVGARSNGGAAREREAAAERRAPTGRPEQDQHALGHPADQDRRAQDPRSTHSETSSQSRVYAS